MSKLLIGEVFDTFWMTELEILTSNQYKINGHLNQSWYDQQELELLGAREYAKWKEMKPLAFQIIKGNKTPQVLKVVFMYPKKGIFHFLEEIKSSFKEDQIEGLFLNIRYENNNLTIVTGTSIAVFSMDKSLEKEWDEKVKVFLKAKEIVFEEM
ncbi:DUF5721 family protein [Velocimicrobium porci]|uniref:Uncharacterized protein n=1 Tax=Velocimicrobium porci TaxID=2606634 RepID=A0A6L5Y0B1_9FIRM|nr:DUF5721 family protein [Velocimicrobium porci]MSS64267.1 hypothetical protein [Velocimicrobium porci]